MKDEPGDGQIHTICHSCGGTGLVNRPRLFLSLQTGEPSTVLEPRRCTHCGSDSGTLPGLVPPV